MIHRVEIDETVFLEKFRHLREPEPKVDIELLYGGRDGAKSWTVAELLTEESMFQDYFRGLLIKETHASIKDAQWQTVKDVCENEDWKVDPLFTFNTSPLEIRCINGNKFLCRGMDSPGKIKSLSNPSHAWIEEGDQITQDSFLTILTSLRNNFGDVKLYMTFNPEAKTPDFRDFWIYKMFFAKYAPQKDFIGEINVKLNNELITLRFRATHSTYHDNPFVSPQRRAMHESLQETDYYRYRVFTLGEWGNPLNDCPWAYAFDRRKHVSDGLKIPHPQLNRDYPLILSWDFNRNPMCCSVIQDYENHARVLETIKIFKASPDIVCEYILVNYPNCLYLVTGDYSGNNESSLYGEQITHYTIIKESLNLSDEQLIIKPNPELKKNSTHVNYILSKYKITMHGEKAKALIFDCENVKRRADGTIIKDDRNDPAQQSDSLDTFRYFCNIFLDWVTPAAVPQITPDRKNVMTFVEEYTEQAGPTKKMISPAPITANIYAAAKKAISNIEQGKLVECTRTDYHENVRTEILKQAGKWIEWKDSARAQIALAEIRRLDSLLGGITIYQDEE